MLSWTDGDRGWGHSVLEILPEVKKCMRLNREARASSVQQNQSDESNPVDHWHALSSYYTLTNIPDGPVGYVVVSAKKLPRPKRQVTLLPVVQKTLKYIGIISGMSEDLTSQYRSSQPETYSARPMLGQPAVPVPPSSASWSCRWGRSCLPLMVSYLHFILYQTISFQNKTKCKQTISAAT